VVNAIALLPGGVVLLGTDGTGILRSTDGGRRFAPSNDGFFGHLVARTLFDPGSGRVFAALRADRVSGGVLSAPGPEGPWRVAGSGLLGREVLALALAGRRLFAGTDAGLFTLSGDSVWRRVPTTADGLDHLPRVSEVVVADGAILLATPMGILRSVDEGATWSRRVLGLGGGIEALAVASMNRRLVLAQTALGTFRSSDGGASWEAMAGPFSTTARTYALLFRPGDDDVALAATSDGLFRTADAGRSWAPRGGGVPFAEITGLAASPDGRFLYSSAFVVGGVWRSADGGLSWQEVPTTGLTTPRVLGLAVDPSSPGRLLAAAAAGGLHLLQPEATTAVAPSPLTGMPAQR
jgi:photosystem II stability/assembly factor-like uncharacterized protein